MAFNAIPRQVFPEASGADFMWWCDDHVGSGRERGGRITMRPSMEISHGRRIVVSEARQQCGDGAGEWRRGSGLGAKVRRREEDFRPLWLCSSTSSKFFFFRSSQLFLRGRALVARSRPSFVRRQCAYKVDLDRAGFSSVAGP